MAITTSTDDLNIIAALDDEPNDVGGLTAAQLKAKFDEAVLDLQTYINTVLIPLLDAVNLPYTYGSASTIKDEMDAIIAGGVSDGSVTTAKLADGAATFAKGGHGGTTAAGGAYNLINALSGITPVSADKFPFLDADGATAGSVTLANLLVALQTAGVPRIETGTYTGTGTYGSSNPNSIVFSAAPKFVYVMATQNPNGEPLNMMVWIGGTTCQLFYNRSAADAWYPVIGIASLSGVTLSWYEDDVLYVPAGTQCNKSGVVYRWFAIE